MTKVFNKENFRKLIEVIDVSGRSWLDCDADMLNDEWNTGLTHRDPAILRVFGFQCVDRANLMEAVKIVDDFQEEDKKNRNGLAKEPKPLMTEDSIKPTNHKEVN